jgi:hypothetical protein
MNEVIEMPRRESAGLVAAEVHQYSAVDIRQRVNLVQEIMRSLMKQDTHYGVIPGTKKPSLYKPGAEMLCVTFRIADKYEVEDLTVNGMARYRVRCIGVHQITDVVLGEGLGECSSHEEKYKWRGAICDEEFDITPENQRRIKFNKAYGKVEKKQQLRTESADQANTILKMACKRAKIAMTLNVTGASDIFTQDLEDLPEELRHDEAGEPTLSPLATKWIDAANAATTASDLVEVWKQAVKEINAAKDVSASNAVKEVVTARGLALKAAAPPVQAEPDTPIPAELESLIADLGAAADSGIEAFDGAWGSLSKATKDKITGLAGVYEKLHSKAESVGGHVPE